MTLSISWKIIKNIDELITYESQWQKLAKSSHDGFFTSPAWLLEWINIYWRESWELNVIIGTIDGNLSVLAPFYIQKRNVFGIIHRAMFPLGQGEMETEEVASEYQDILIATEHENLYALIANQIETASYDHLSWRAISKRANILKVYKHLSRTKVNISGVRYAINDKCSEKALVSKNNRYKWNKCKTLLQNNNAHFYWCTTDQLQDHWLQLKKIHTQRWHLKNKLGAFTSKAFNTFHQSLINNGLCRISVLTIEGELAAINYYLISDDCLYFYQSGWSSNYASLSPGFSLHKWSIENNKLNCYDFMMGEKTQSYKKSYGCNQITDMYNIHQLNKPIKYLLSKLIKKILHYTNKK